MSPHVASCRAMSRHVGSKVHRRLRGLRGVSGHSAATPVNLSTRHVSSCRIMTRHVASIRVVSRRVASCRVISRDFASRRFENSPETQTPRNSIYPGNLRVSMRHVASCRVMSRHVAPCRVISRHVGSKVHLRGISGDSAETPVNL